MTDLTVPGPMVEVEWTDSGGQSYWHDPADSVSTEAEMQCLSVGYMAEDSERVVCLVMGVGGMGQHLNSMTIPRSNVLKVTRLRR